MLLRRQSKTGLFGWISYTLSRSERYRDGDWVPYDFDRPHLFNVVAGLPLRRNWDVGVRLQYQSGRPTTTTAGYNAAHGAGYLRFDFRIDKRAVWRSWLLDFYVDVTNAALLPEEVQPGDGPPLRPADRRRARPLLTAWCVWRASPYESPHAHDGHRGVGRGHARRSGARARRSDAAQMKTRFERTSGRC